MTSSATSYQDINLSYLKNKPRLMTSSATSYQEKSLPCHQILDIIQDASTKQEPSLYLTWPIVPIADVSQAEARCRFLFRWWSWWAIQQNKSVADPA